MAKFRKKPIEVEMTQWFKMGDHPAVTPLNFVYDNRSNRCKECNNIYDWHGWVDTTEGGHIVCPSDWIATDVAGNYYPIKDHIQKATYEEV